MGVSRTSQGKVRFGGRASSQNMQLLSTYEKGDLWFTWWQHRSAFRLLPILHIPPITSILLSYYRCTWLSRRVCCTDVVDVRWSTTTWPVAGRSECTSTVVRWWNVCRVSSCAMRRHCTRPVTASIVNVTPSRRCTSTSCSRSVCAACTAQGPYSPSQSSRSGASSSCHDHTRAR